MKHSESKIEVRYCETDRMGIVHHSRYYPWFEIGRNDFFKRSGMPYDKVEKEGILLPLIESHCNYHHGAQYGDTVIVKTSLSELSPAKIKYSYRVLRESDGILLAEGYTVHAFTTPALKCVNLRKKNPQLWDILLQLYDGGDLDE